MATKYLIKEIQTSEAPCPGRWDLLKKEAAKSDIEIDFETITVLPADFTAKLAETMTPDLNAIFFSARDSRDIIKKVPSSSMESHYMGACDLLVQENKFWWPRCLLEDAFVKGVSHEVKELDQKKGALIVGANGTARLLAPALTKLGYSVVHVAEDNEELGKSTVAELNRKIFDVDFKWISQSDITQLNGDYSILVNTLPLGSSPILDELYFFNFLAPGAVVIDLNLVPFSSPLITEAEKYGTRHLSGAYIAAYMDLAFAENILGISLDRESYIKALVEKIKLVPFDVKTHLDRFVSRGEI